MLMRLDNLVINSGAESVRNAFFLFVGGGTLLAIFAQLFNQAGIGIVLVVAAMFGYIFIGHRFRYADQVGQQFADSIYYMGFLFTLVSMMLSLMQFSISDVSFNQIISQFAISITTTIIGLTARIVIGHFRIDPDDEVQIAEQKLALEIQRMVQQVALVNDHIAHLHRQFQEASRRSVATHVTEREALAQAAAEVVARLQAASTQISDELSIAMQRMSAPLAGIADTIARFTQQLAEIEIAPLHQLIAQMQLLRDELTAIRDSSIESREIVQQLQQIQQLLATQQQQLAEGQHQITRHSGGVVTDLEQLQQQLRQLTEQYVEQMERFNEASGQFQRDATESAASVKQFVTTLTETAHYLTDRIGK